MKTSTITILIIVLVAAFALWWFMGGKGMAPSGVPENEEDTISEIQSELQNIDLGSLDNEFQGIDTELNNL